MTTTLSSAHQATLDAIRRHPAVHNLHWNEVRSLLEAIAEVRPHGNGSIKYTRNGQTLLLHPDSHKDIDTDEQLKEVRQFLERSNEVLTPPEGSGVNLLVVIDHREARIYRTELKGTVPQRIVPHDPGNEGRHLHSVSNDANGQRLPEIRSYYESIAKSLHGATSILLFGTGKGASSAMHHLAAEIRDHHKDIAAHLVGTVTIDEHHLTEGQLLAKAREFYEHPVTLKT
jgi:hypothetical protein